MNGKLKSTLIIMTVLNAITAVLAAASIILRLLAR